MEFLDLNELHKSCFECEKCNLSTTREYVCVKRGSNTSNIMIIGEAPGYTEDITGVAFVGDSGAILEKIMQSVGINSEQTYITNIVKCRPPNNRKPDTKEIKECKPWLIEQIRLLQPKILVLLGGTAYTGLIGSKWVDKTSFGITKHRGIWFESEYCTKTICSFHPAYLLYNWRLDEGSPKYLAWQDWINIKKELDSEQSL